LKNERDRVAHELTQMGFSVLPSAANFLLFSGFESEPKLVWQGVLDAGVLIRDVGIPGFLRVTIGKSAENDQFLAAILPFAP
jgi:histidinol-phosphate aminotransferase